MAVAYINHQGHTKSPTPQREADLIPNWAELLKQIGRHFQPLASDSEGKGSPPGGVPNPLLEVGNASDVQIQQ